MAIQIKFDSANHPEEPTLILATRNGDKFGQVNAENIVLADYLNDASEIQFTVHKYIDGVKDYLWDKLTNFRLIWCKEWDVWFEMTVEIDESSKQDITKTCSCTRLGQAELSQIMLYNIEINTEDDIERDDYEVTVLYDKDNPAASLLNRIMEKAPHYSIIHVDDTIASIQRTFSFDGTSIYDAFQDIAEEIGCLFVLHSNSGADGSIQRTISVYDLESTCLDCGYRGEFTDTCPECGGTNIQEGFGNDTTVFVTSDELADGITFTTDTGSVKNCFKLEAGDDLMTATVRNCNPNGSDYIWYLTDEVKEDMSDELVSKIDSYDSLYKYYKSDCEYTEIDSDLLSSYNSIVNKYQAYNSDLETITLPIIGYANLMTAYYNTIDLDVYLQSGLMPSVETSSTTAAEQAALLTADNISPVAVTNASYISLATANSVVLAVAKVVVKSGYQVKVNTSSISGTTWTGNFTITNYSDEDDTADSDTITVTITDDYETYVQQLLYKSLSQEGIEDVSITGLFSSDYDTFCAELQKYCLDSLQSFYDACLACVNILIEQGVADGETWVDLYDDLYVPYYNKLSAIESEIALRQSEIDVVVGTTDENGGTVSYGVQTYIIDIVTDVQNALDFEGYLGSDLWLEFSAFRREDKYSNSNYISDGLNNAELFSNALEFINVAEKEIYKSAELQHSISSTLRNLLIIKEFRPLTDMFEVGNWIRVQVDDSIYKLRLISYEIDYDNLDNISVDFSDVMKTADGLSDQQDILSQVSSMATSYSSTQRQASLGSSSYNVTSDWVSNGLDVTNSKIVSGSTNQSQTWDSNGLLFRKYNPVTETYDDTQLKIINSTIAITDDNWESVKTAIGNYYYTDPETGEVVSTYGINAETLVGKLIFGERLSIYNESGSMTFGESGLSITNGTNTFTVDPNSNKLVVISDSDGDIFYVDNDGTLYITGTATFSGTMSTTTGTIGGWIIGERSLYVGTSSISSTTVGTYIGTNGIRQYHSESAYTNLVDGVLTSVGASISSGTISDSSISGGTISSSTISSPTITGGTISGSTITSSGTYTAKLYNGELAFYNSGASTEVGVIQTMYTSSKYGIGMTTSGSYIALGTNNGIRYYINNGLNPSSETEDNLFYGSVRFNEEVYFGDSSHGVYITASTYSSADALEICDGGLYVNGDLGCSGTKYRVVNTDSYGAIGMNAFETANAHFGDTGSGVIGSDGVCEIEFDVVFAETIEKESGYYLLITQTSEGSINYSDKQQLRFVVYGEPGTTFDWMVVAYQKDYASNRLERLE